MQISKLIETNQFRIIACEDQIHREIKGLYASDLLSWVMSHAKAQNAHLTILPNINTLAVASLLDLSCIIFCEDSKVDEKIIERAIEENIPLLITSLSIVETIILINTL